MPAPATSTDLPLVEQVAAIRWWHRIDLGNGVVTPGEDRTPEKLARIGLPADLSGTSVLDIGAWDGFFSFEAERRGAARVVAMDRWDGTAGGDQRGFLLARHVLGSRVEAVRAEVCSLTEDDFSRLGAFNLVLLLGVLYHVTEPMRALANVRRLCAGRLILETEADMLWIRRPAIGFYPGVELNGDSSNWFAPNIPALVGMLRAVGFQASRVMWVTPWAGRLARAWKHRRRHGTPILHTLQRARVVIHAEV
jgi:tRNA (mo5U34)-methyltransferase